MNHKAKEYRKKKLCRFCNNDIPKKFVKLRGDPGHPRKNCCVICWNVMNNQESGLPDNEPPTNPTILGILKECIAWVIAKIQADKNATRH